MALAPSASRSAWPERETDRHTERARTSDGWRFRAGAERQRRNRHQVIRAEPVKESEGESCREKYQNVTAAVS